MSKSWDKPLRIATVALASCMAIHVRAAPDSVALELRALGAPALSPIGQSVLGAEILDSRPLRQDTPQARKATTALDRQLETVRRGGQPAVKPDAKSSAIVEMAIKLDAAQREYEKRRNGIEGSFSWQEGARGYIEVSDKGGNSSNIIVRVATKIYTSANTRSAGEDMANQLKAAKADYDNQVNDIVTYALTQTDKSTRDKWIAKRNGLKEVDVAEALNEILSENGGFFNHGLTKGMSPEAREAISNAKVDILKDSLGRVAAKNDAQMKQIESQLVQGFGGTNRRLDALGQSFKEFDIRLNQNSKALAQLSIQTQSNLTLLRTAVDKVRADVNQINGQIGAIQSSMWRSMSPAEQVKALDDGFFPHLLGEDRKKLRGSIAQTANILAARDNALSGLSAVSGIGHFAASMGVPIDTYNLDRNIQIASAAVNVVASIATGNYMGALMQAGGLFPGASGPDPTQEKLDKIISLQYEILDAIENLSRQLAESTYAMMSALDAIDSKIELNNRVALSELQKVGPGQCSQFVRWGQVTYSMRGGIFPTYDVRRQHFDSSLPNDWFRQCTRYLYSAATLVAAKGNVETNLTPAFIADAVLFAQTNQDGLAIDPKSFGWRFSNMRDYTFSVLSPGAVRPNCEKRILARLAVAPERYSLAEKGDPQCMGSDIAQDSEHIKLADGKALNVRDALEHALSPGAVREVGEYILFMAPYFEFVKKDASGTNYIGLYTRQELLAGKGNPDAPESLSFSQGYLDVLHLALAQQTILAGTYLARPVAALLRSKEQQFGKTAKFVAEPDEKASQAEKDTYRGITEHCAMSDANYAMYPYVLAACFLAHNIPFRTNVIHSLVRSALIASGASTLEYAWALESTDRANIEHALPDLPLVRAKVDDKEQWAIEILDAHKKSLKLALPTASEIRAGHIAYPFSTEPLRELRQRMLERYLLASSWKSIEKDPTKRFYLRQAVLNDPSFAAVPFLSSAEPPRAAPASAIK